MSDGNAMAAAYGMQSIGTIAGAISERSALKAQGNYQKSVYDMNAKFAEFEATDAIDRGKNAIHEYKKKGKALIGAQRAALAAQGIEVDSGSASEVQQDTRIQIERETINMKNNAWREAWGYRAQALANSYQGQIAQASASMNARNTLAAGGLNAATYGMMAGAHYKPGKTPPPVLNGGAASSSVINRSPAQYMIP